MPNPNNRIKQTGDTRLNDVGYDLGADDDVAAELDITSAQSESAVFHPSASGVPEGESRMQRAQSTYRGYLADAQAQVEAQPLAALGGAFLLGFVLARLTR